MELDHRMYFFLTNTMYQKTNTRNIVLMNGLPTHDPMLLMLWTLAISSNMAIPPSLHVISEITVIMSSMFISKVMTIILLITNFTTATYSLYMYSMINYKNQLKMMNTSTHMSSINLLTYISHIWPMLIMSMIPMKLMAWC